MLCCCVCLFSIRHAFWSIINWIDKIYESFFEMGFSWQKWHKFSFFLYCSFVFVFRDPKALVLKVPNLWLIEHNNQFLTMTFMFSEKVFFCLWTRKLIDKFFPKQNWKLASFFTWDCSIFLVRVRLSMLWSEKKFL